MPNPYQTICFIQNVAYLAGSMLLVQYIDITLIMANNIIGINIDLDTANLDMFLILSPTF